LIEKSQEYQNDLYLGFVDYAKAFDSIEHVYLWRALTDCNVPKKYIRILKFIYENSSGRIKTESLSRPFRMERGIKQGRVLSPKLFNAALENIFKSINWTEIGLSIDGYVLLELRFADDTVVIAGTPGKLITGLEALFTESKKVGLEANFQKTKVMSNTDVNNFTINGHIIEKVQEYKYLGQLISFEDRGSKEVNARIRAEWNSFWSQKKFFCGNLPIFHKMRLFDASILSILTYGAQTWSLSETSKNSLVVAQRKMERKMLGLRWQDMISNQRLRKKTRVKDVVTTVKALKWSWAGHIARYNDDRIPKIIEKWTPRGTRKRGKPKIRWKDDIENFGSIFWRKKAKNRKKWNQIGESFALAS
jgi:Reverse transcriptase (RNA-dependent DNA polymerase)